MGPSWDIYGEVWAAREGRTREGDFLQIALNLSPPPFPPVLPLTISLEKEEKEKVAEGLPRSPLPPPPFPCERESSPSSPSFSAFPPLHSSSPGRERRSIITDNFPLPLRWSCTVFLHNNTLYARKTGPRSASCCWIMHFYLGQEREGSLKTSKLRCFM